MIAVNCALLEADADVVERPDGGLVDAVELAEALGPGRGGGREPGADGGGDGHGVTPVVGAATGLAAQVPADAVEGVPRRSGWAQARRGLSARSVAGDRAATPTPVVGAGTSRSGRARAHTAHMAGLRWLRRRSRRQVLADALVLAGLVAFVVLVYVVLVLGVGALVGHTSSPDVALSVLATAVVALAFDPVQTRLERAASRAVNDGRPSPYDVLRTFSRDGHRQLRRRRSSRRGWPRCSPTAPAPSGPRCGSWSAAGCSSAATWPPSAADREPVLDPRPRPRRPTTRAGCAGRCRCSRPVSCSARSSSSEREHRPLSSVEARLFAGLADQAGPVLRGARLHAELTQRLEELSTRARGAAHLAPAPGRGPGRRAPHPRAQHPRRGPAAPRRPRREPPPRRDALATLARAGRRAAGRAGARGGRGDRGPAWPSRGASTRAGWAPTVWSPPSRRPWPGPARSRSRSAATGVGRYSAEHRGHGVLLLPGGGAERRQALGSDHDPGLPRWTRRPAGLRGRGRRHRLRPGHHPRPAPVWRTCATASSRPAARSPRAPRPGGGTRIRARLPATGGAGAGTRGRADVTARIAWALTALTFVAVVADICRDRAVPQSPLRGRGGRPRLPVRRPGRPRRRRARRAHPDAGPPAPHRAAAPPDRVHRRGVPADRGLQHLGGRRERPWLPQPRRRGRAGCRPSSEASCRSPPSR